MKYLIILKPLDKFFFGKEQTFGENNYFAKSSCFPQQTQLLGMLRKEILIQNGFLTQKRKGEWVDKNKANRAKEFVGGEQFNIASSNLQNLGEIKSVSPIFMLNREKKFCYFTAKNLGFYLTSDKDEPIELRFLENDEIYKEKVAKDITAQIISEDETVYAYDEVFIEDEQVGIQKSLTGVTDDNAFFRKLSYKLDLDFSFAFVLELKERERVVLDNAIVTLGAERSQFKMEVHKEDDLCHSYHDKIETIYKKEKVTKLILLSDSYMEASNETIRSKAQFSITQGVAVRTINSKVSKWKGKTEELEKYKFSKSITYNFFERGSVFYRPNGLEELLTNENLQQIGYNQFIIIEGEENA